MAARVEDEIGFTGEFDYNVDDKSRVLIPPKFRDGLGQIVVLARGDNGEIRMYAKEHFDNTLRQLAAMNTDAFQHRARFLRAANEVEVDRQYRIVIPPVLREHVGISGRVIIVGNGVRVEIWNPETWKNLYASFVSENGKTGDDVQALQAAGLRL